MLPAFFPLACCALNAAAELWATVLIMLLYVYTSSSYLTILLSERSRFASFCWTLTYSPLLFTGRALVQALAILNQTLLSTAYKKWWLASSQASEPLQHKLEKEHSSGDRDIPANCPCVNKLFLVKGISSTCFLLNHSFYTSRCFITVQLFILKEYLVKTGEQRILLVKWGVFKIGRFHMKHVKSWVQME